MILTKRITFYGNENDAYGLPIPWKSYMIFSSSSSAIHNKSVASILPITIDARDVANPYHIFDNDQAAIEKALAYLKQLPSNKGLNLEEME
jgi:hypothetical protein